MQTTTYPHHSTCAREARVRRMLKSQGLALRKSRLRSQPTIDNQGAYAVWDPFINAIVLGVRFEYSLDDIEAWYADPEASV